MKKIKLFVIIVSCGLVVTSCSKDGVEGLSNDAGVKHAPQYKNDIVYDNNWCTTAEGVKGLECIVGSNQDCSMLVACASNSIYPTYDDVLHEKYTNEEIEAFSNTNTRITDADLIEALRQDGFPIY